MYVLVYAKRWNINTFLVHLSHVNIGISCTNTINPKKKSLNTSCAEVIPMKKTTRKKMKKNNNNNKENTLFNDFRCFHLSSSVFFLVFYHLFRYSLSGIFIWALQVVFTISTQHNIIGAKQNAHQNKIKTYAATKWKHRKYGYIILGKCLVIINLWLHRRTLFVLLYSSFPKKPLYWLIYWNHIRYRLILENPLNTKLPLCNIKQFVLHVPFELPDLVKVNIQMKFLTLLLLDLCNFEEKQVRS